VRSIVLYKPWTSNYPAPHGRLSELMRARACGAYPTTYKGVTLWLYDQPERDG